MTRRADGIFVVAALPENGSAFRSGEVEVGDIIVAIDGEPLEERSMQYAASLICGPVGTEVNLTLLRGADLIRDCGNHALYDVHHDWFVCPPLVHRNRLSSLRSRDMFRPMRS